MNGNSKRERIDSLVRRAVREACMEMAFDHPDRTEFLRKHYYDLGITVASQLTSNPYRFKELTDIIEWKRPPKERV